MRRRWEEEAGDDLDQPVTITEGQLRALKRGALAGVFAIILALVAVGLAGWSLLSGPNEIKPQPAMAENGTPQPVAPSAAVAPTAAAPTTGTTVVGGAQTTKPVETVVKPAPVAAKTTTVAAAPKSKTTRTKAAAPSNEKPMVIPSLDTPVDPAATKPVIEQPTTPPTAVPSGQ